MLDRLLSSICVFIAQLLGISSPAHASADKKAAWMVDRAVGNTEKYWLFTPLQRMFCLTATVAPTLSSRLTKEQLESAMLRVVHQPGFFNLVCTLHQPHSESSARWAAPNNVAVIRQLIQRSITVLSDTDSVNEVIERELATDFDISDSSVALWRLVVLPASGTLVWTFQHILGDGIAARDSMQLLLQQLADEATTDEPPEPYIRPQLTGAVESLLPPSLTVASWITAIRHLVAAKPKPFIGSTTQQLPRSALSTQVHIEQLTRAQTMKAQQKARKGDLTMHGLIVAASASALRVVFKPGATPCSFVTPINLRPYMSPDHQRSVGNLIASHTEMRVCSGDGNSDSGEDDWQFARRYMAALKKSVLLKYRTQTIMSWLGVKLGMASTLASDVAKLHNLRKGTVELSNLGAVDTVAQCANMSFTGRAHNDGPLLLLGPLTCNGRLSLSLSHCSPLVSREEAKRYVEEMIRLMTE